MDKYYLGNTEELKKFCNLYLPLVIDYCKSILDIDLRKDTFEGDHLGIQTSSTKEYSFYYDLLSSYMTHNFTNELHGRRVSIFSFKNTFTCSDINLKGVEIFEPKQDIDVSKLKLGIEHISIISKGYDKLLNTFPDEHLGKSAEYSEGKFFKTKFENLVEIEFRDRSLIKKNN